MAATLLICDNEESLRTLVRASLEDRGYAFAEASDGERALQLARELRPDLIVLDVVMPGRSGLSVVEELRADPRLASTPIVMLTASPRTAVRTASGARPDRVVGKPFSPDKLAQIVDELLPAQ